MPEHIRDPRLLAGVRKQSKQSVYNAPEADDDEVCGIVYAIKIPNPSSTTGASNSDC